MSLTLLARLGRLYLDRESGQASVWVQVAFGLDLHPTDHIGQGRGLLALREGG